MTTDALLAALQLADGLFPSGGFAHSLGLETYVQDGRIADRTGLEAFLAAHLEGSVGPADAIAVACSSRAAARDELAACLELDARLDAMKIVPELRAASVQMGRQTARAARAMTRDAVVDALGRAVARGATPGHHAVVFGAIAGRHAIEAEAAAAAYLWSTCTLLVGAALRLMPLGQVEGQAVLAGLRPAMARLAADAAAGDADDMWSFAPALELAGLRHADLDTRLFRS